MLVDEWFAVRRGSLRMLPIAVTLFGVLGGVIAIEGLHRSEFGFLAGLLIAATGYWAILEAITVIRVDRLLRKAARLTSTPDAEQVAATDPTA
jgi:hypothetical protein